MTDRERPGPGGWNRIHLIVDDLDGEIARLTCVTGGGQHLQRPAGAGDHHSRCGHVESFHAAVSEQGEGVDDIEVIDEVVGQVDHRSEVVAPVYAIMSPFREIRHPALGVWAGR